MQAHLSIIKLYIGAYPLHHILYCNKGLPLPFPVEYFTKDMLISPTSFCLRDANGSAHECGACPHPDSYVFVRPFFDEKEVTT